MIQLLDRPGGRHLLGAVATQYFRKIAREEVAVAYIDGMWTRKVGRDFLPDGPRFQYRYDDFDRWKYQIAEYESAAREFWLRHYSPKNGDTILDVGAGRGEDTIAFSRAVGATGRIVAIEAHPTSFAILKNFCSLNRLRNVTVIERAMMDKPGIVHMTESQSSWTENTIEIGNESTGIEVQSGTIDDLCEQLGLKDIAFLKMNIEGAERDALIGMERSISRVQQVCIACHDFRNKNGESERFRTRDFVTNFLSTRGFTVRSRPDSPYDFVRDHLFGVRHLP
ncbi:MAG TPA: FkbM family methyltransferase [Candidatus Sulfotelmatobacter sp.]|nr:FkbM family methyltransferase [Candidatus Sulfotelmatobacter sp.]